MVFSQHQHFSVRLAPVVALAFGLALTGCSPDNDAVVEDEPVDSPEVVNVGVKLSSPGLIAGINPAEVTGAEVDLVTALVQRMDVLPAEADMVWAPTSTTSVTADFEDFDIAIGQFELTEFESSAAQVGPYVTVEPGLLVHHEPDDTVTPPLAATSIAALSDLADASVCVVADSVAAGAQLPTDQTVVESTVTECEVGMRSGRYDAISADDLQLAGLLVDPAHAQRYELTSWEDFAADTDEAAELDERLVTSGSYWIGVQPATCDEASGALEALIDEGVVDEAFSAFESVDGFQLQTVEAEEVSAQGCENSD